MTQSGPTHPVALLLLSSTILLPGDEARVGALNPTCGSPPAFWHHLPFTTFTGRQHTRSNSSHDQLCLAKLTHGSGRFPMVPGTVQMYKHSQELLSNRVMSP